MTKKPEDKHQTTQPEAPVDVATQHPRGRLGERLSQARQKREISIAEASERLRIRSNYLEALESGDWAPLPEEVYVMGFLRQYASLLGVDISSDIEALKTGEYQLTKPFTMPDPPIAMNRTWAIAAGACFVLLLILFNVVDEGEKEPAMPPGTLQLASPDSIPDTSLPHTMPEADSTTPSDAAQPTVDTASLPVAESAAQAAVAEPVEMNPNLPVAPQAPSAVEAVAPAKETPAPAVAQAPATKPSVVAVIEHDADQSATASGGGHSYQISAVSEDVWLQVHDPDGNLVKEALLRSGQSMRLSSDAAYLLLTAGNPLALSISIDDRIIAEAGTLGEKEKVLHDYHLTPTDSGSAR